MFDEKGHAQALATTASNLASAIEARDMYQRFWNDESTKNADLQKTIAEQLAEIVGLTEELNTLRETGTIVAHVKAAPEVEA